MKQNKETQKNIDTNKPESFQLSEISKEQTQQYFKISLDHEEQTFLKGQSIVDVAKILGIQLSIAKTVIYSLRKEQRRQKRDRQKKQCGVKQLQRNQIRKFRIVSMTYGNITVTSEHSYSLQEQNTNPLHTSTQVTSEIYDL